MIHVLFAAVMTLAGAPAIAGCRDTAENRRACMGDLFRLCATSRSVAQAVICLQHKRHNLSHPCAAALAACEGKSRN